MSALADALPVAVTGTADRPVAALAQRIARRTATAAAPLSSAPRPLAADLARRDDGAGGLRLAASAWTVSGPAGDLADCRLVRLWSDKVDILNALYFPVVAGTVPVYALDLVCIGPQIRIAFIDLQHPGLSPAQAEALGVVARGLKAASLLPDAGPAPAWSVTASAGGAVHSRFTGDGLLGQVAIEAVDYLDVWFARLTAHAVRSAKAGRAAVAVDTAGAAEVAGAADVDAAAARALAAYKADHAAHTPSLPFLAKAFDAAWTQRFASGFLFA